MERRVWLLGLLIGCRSAMPAAPAPSHAPAPMPSIVDAGIGDVGVDAGAPPEGTELVDLDGDGRLDELRRDPADVVLHRAGGEQAVSFELPSAVDGNVVTDRLTLDGRAVVVVEGSGHEVDHDGPRTRSYTWAGVGLFAFPTGESPRLLWEYRIEMNGADGTGGWRFAPQADGSVLVTTSLGDAGLPRTPVTARLTRTGDGTYELSTCWQATPPANAEPPCETVLRSAFRLRPVETMQPGEGSSGYAAGTRVRVLQRGTTRRGTATLSCVRTLGDAPSLGWTFVTDAERARCSNQ